MESRQHDNYNLTLMLKVYVFIIIKLGRQAQLTIYDLLRLDSSLTQKINFYEIFLFYRNQCSNR